MAVPYDHFPTSLPREMILEGSLQQAGFHWGDFRHQIPDLSWFYLLIFFPSIPPTMAKSYVHRYFSNKHDHQIPVA